MEFPPIPERAPRSVQNARFCAKSVQKVRFCTLLGTLSGIGGNPTYCTDDFFLRFRLCGSYSAIHNSIRFAPPHFMAQVVASLLRAAIQHCRASCKRRRPVPSLLACLPYQHKPAMANSAKAFQSPKPPETTPSAAQRARRGISTQRTQPY